MTIMTGEKIPDMDVILVGPDGPAKVAASKIFEGKQVVLFSVPGAFTPTCSARHMPGFRDNLDALKAKGIDKVICMAVNDAFVMEAWARAQGVVGDIDMLADGNGDFAKALGLEMDISSAGMGLRSRRFSMLVDNGVVKILNIDQPGAFDVSSAEYMLGQV